MKKKILYFVPMVVTIFTVLYATSADQGHKLDPSRTTTTDHTAHRDASDSLQLQKLFKHSDAERILGESAHLKDSTLTVRPDASVYKCSYFADSTDQKTGKTGAVYVMIEHYQKITSAKHVYSSIKTANENHEGVSVIDDLGEEAYFHSDGKNFFLIIARKGGKVLRLKVNKITSQTSLDEFNRIARDIVAML